MDIFKWIQELEDVYKTLIKKARDENTSELQALKNNQEKMLEFTLNEKENIVNLALKDISEATELKIKDFRSDIEKIIKLTEKKFQEERDNLVNSIINELGLEF